jgi:iron(III) transport system substrate-binding protein
MPFNQRTSAPENRMNRRIFLRLTALGGGAALLAACQSPAPANPATTAPPDGPAAPAKPAAPAAPAKPAEPVAKGPTASTGASSELDALVAPAKQEGEVVIYMGRAGSRQLRDGVAEFEKKYGIKMTAVVGSGNEGADKVLAERDTGLFTADIWMGGLTTINSRLLPKSVLDPIEPQFVLPEIKDKSLWYKGQHWWGDPEKKFTFLFSASPSPIASYNTSLVKDSDIQSWWDLLDAKWKGKIVSRDPAQAGSGGNTAYLYFHPQLGQDFLKKLYTEQDVVITKDARQGAEWLALGKYSIYVLGSGNDVQELKGQGLPVDDWLRPTKEGARISAGGTGTVSVFNRAAHPNASKLFINWWLSKEGQLTSQRVDPEDESLRMDIAKDMVNPEHRRDPNVEYSFMDADPRVLAGEAEMLDFMKSVLGPGR